MFYSAVFAGCCVFHKGLSICEVVSTLSLSQLSNVLSGIITEQHGLLTEFKPDAANTYFY